MTKEEILKYNKMIADFMEFQTKIILRNIPIILDGALRYNSSWGWLMPVVEKLEKEYQKNNEMPNFTISVNLCTFQKELSLYNFKDYFYFLKEASKLDTAYLTVVILIEWYNLQKIK